MNYGVWNQLVFLIMSLKLFILSLQAMQKVLRSIFLKLQWFGGNIYKLLEKNLKKIKVAFKWLIELSVELNA